MPFLALLLTYGAVKCQVNRIGDELPGELAKLRALGVPVEPSELAPDPPIPAGENAAAILNTVIDEFKKIKEEQFYKDGSKRIGELSSNRKQPEDDPLVVGLVDRLETFLQRVDRVQTKSRLDFSRDWSQGANLMFPEYAYLKEIAKLQAHRSRIAAKSGDHRRSLNALRTAFSLYGLVGEEPTIIGALVAVAIQAIGYAALEFHLEKFQNDQRALSDVRKMLESIPEAIDLRRPMYGEVVMTRQWIRSLGQEGAGSEADYFSDAETALSIALKDPQVRRMYEVRYLQLWQKAFQKMPEDGRDWRRVQAAGLVVDRELEKPMTADTYLNQLIFPVMGQYPQSAGTAQARIRLAILATRLLQDRANGLPRDLAKYGNVATDPLDGLPMRYIRRGNGFKIWSIGQNLVDDGGKKFWRNAGMSNQDTDEVLMFSYPEQPPKVSPGIRSSTPIGGPFGPPPAKTP
jgi:hypothetical protein